MDYAEDNGLNCLYLTSDNKPKTARFFAGMIYYDEFGNFGDFSEHAPFDKYVIIEVERKRVTGIQSDVHPIDSVNFTAELIRIVKTKNDIPPAGIRLIIHIPSHKPKKSEIRKYQADAQQFYSSTMNGEISQETERNIRRYHKLFSSHPFGEFREQKIKQIRSAVLQIPLEMFVNNYIKSKMYEKSIRKALD